MLHWPGPPDTPCGDMATTRMPLFAVKRTLKPWLAQNKSFAQYT